MDKHCPSVSRGLFLAQHFNTGYRACQGPEILETLLYRYRASLNFDIYMGWASDRAQDQGYHLRIDIVSAIAQLA